MNDYSIDSLLDAIDAEDFLQAIARIAKRPVDCVDSVKQEAPPAGCAGYVCPKTFLGVSWSSGEDKGHMSIVAKWSKSGKREGRVYELLANQDDLVPRAYSCRRRASEDEILLIERLPETGVDPEDPKAVESYLQSLGRLNAIEPGDLLPRLDCAAKLEYGMHVLPGLLEECAGGRHGEDLLKEASLWPQDPTIIRSGMNECLRSIETCPLGLLHFDVAPQNCGRRSREGGILFFDLHGAQHGPVVGDISSWSDPVSCATRVRSARIGIWRKSLRDAGGPDISVEQVCDWADAVKPVMVSGVLGWFQNRLHDGKADFTDDIEAAKSAFRGWVRDLVSSMRRCIVMAADRKSTR